MEFDLFKMASEQQLPAAIQAKYNEHQKKYKIVGIGSHVVQSPRRMSLAREMAELEADRDYNKKISRLSEDERKNLKPSHVELPLVVDANTIYAFVAGGKR